MYSFPNLESVCCSMSSSNCGFLTCIQISQEAGQVVCYSHLFNNFPQFVVIHTVKDFGIVNKAEVDFFWNSLAFLMIQQMLAIWSLILLPFLNPTWTSGSSRVVYNLSLTFPTRRGFQFQKNSSKIFLCVSIDGKIGSCPKATLDCFSLVSYPLLSYLTTAWICPLEPREGHGGWMKAVSYNQRNEEHGKALCPGTPQSLSSIKWSPGAFSIELPSSLGSHGRQRVCVSRKTRCSTELLAKTLLCLLNGW